MKMNRTHQLKARPTFSKHDRGLGLFFFFFCLSSKITQNSVEIIIGYFFFTLNRSIFRFIFFGSSLFCILYIFLIHSILVVRHASYYVICLKNKRSVFCLSWMMCDGNVCLYLNTKCLSFSLFLSNFMPFSLAFPLSILASCQFVCMCVNKCFQ